MGVLLLRAAAALSCWAALASVADPHAPPAPPAPRVSATITVTAGLEPIGALCRALKRADCPSGSVEESFFGLTADSSSFLDVDSTARWELLGSKPLHNMLAALAPITIRVGGTFTDFTSMPGPRPGVSKAAQKQYNFSSVGWAAINSLVQSLPNSQLVVSVNGLLRHWDQPGIPWDPTNAEAFVRDNIAKGYKIYGYEIGNVRRILQGAAPAAALSARLLTRLCLVRSVVRT
jgi:hypothetical protein